MKLSKPKNSGPAAATNGAWDMQATLDTYCISFTSGELGEKVVGDDRANRLPTELTVFSGVDMLVQARLHDLRRVLEIIQQVALGDIEHLDLDVLAKVGAVHQQLQTTPRRLQCLEVGMVEDLVDLATELGVDLGDHAIDHGLLDRLTAVLGLEKLFDERRHAALGNVVGIVLWRQARLGDDAFKNTVLAIFLAVLQRCIGIHVSAFLG